MDIINKSNILPKDVNLEKVIEFLASQESYGLLKIESIFRDDVNNHDPSEENDSKKRIHLPATQRFCKQDTIYVFPRKKINTFDNYINKFNEAILLIEKIAIKIHEITRPTINSSNLRIGTINLVEKAGYIKERMFYEIIKQNNHPSFEEYLNKKETILKELQIKTNNEGLYGNILINFYPDRKRANEARANKYPYWVRKL